jgi:alginate O-acetyltransferase complex protein AlgI
MIYVFITVTFLWLLFKLTDFSTFLLYIKNIFTNTHIAFKMGADEISILFYALAVILYHAAYLVKETKNLANLAPRYTRLDVPAYGLMLFFIFVNSGAAGAFIYFQF